jgi:hypothetical protein
MQLVESARLTAGRASGELQISSDAAARLAALLHAVRRGGLREHLSRQSRSVTPAFEAPLVAPGASSPASDVAKALMQVPD